MAALLHESREGWRNVASASPLLLGAGSKPLWPAGPAGVGFFFRLRASGLGIDQGWYEQLRKAARGARLGNSILIMAWAGCFKEIPVRGSCSQQSPSCHGPGPLGAFERKVSRFPRSR